MLEALAFFVITITNPMGTPSGVPYPVPFYEQHMNVGHRSAVQYRHLTECHDALRQVRSQMEQEAASLAIMPSRRIWLNERARSLQCLPPDSRPLRAHKRVPLEPAWRWQIGRIDPRGYFQGVSADARYYQEQSHCKSALERLVVSTGRAMREHGQDSRAVQQYAGQIRRQYDCHRVMDAPPPPSIRVDMRLR